MRPANANTAVKTGADLAQMNGLLRSSSRCDAGVRVQTNNFSAIRTKRWGCVTFSVKSGTISWHGSATNSCATRLLNANNFFPEPRRQCEPTFIQNQFGARLADRSRRQDLLLRQLGGVPNRQSLRASPAYVRPLRSAWRFLADSQLRREHRADRHPTRRAAWRTVPTRVVICLPAT